MSLTHLVRDGPLAVLSLARPVGNRISFEMRRELREAVPRVAQSSARALLVRGDGPDFCLGGDVREGAGVPAAELRPKIEVFAEALDQLGRLLDAARTRDAKAALKAAAEALHAGRPFPKVIFEGRVVTRRAAPRRDATLAERASLM